MDSRLSPASTHGEQETTVAVATLQADLEVGASAEEDNLPTALSNPEQPPEIPDHDARGGGVEPNTSGRKHAPQISNMQPACAVDADRGLPQHMNYQMHSPKAQPEHKHTVQLPSEKEMQAYSATERKIMQELDADCDGELSAEDVIAGVRRHAKAQQNIRGLRRRQFLFCLGSLVAMAVIFGLVTAANWQSKELYLSHLDSSDGQGPLLVTRDNQVVSVSQVKTAVPLYLAPFLASEHLREVKEVMYYDCVAEEEVWARVISVRRTAPAIDETGVEAMTADDDPETRGFGVVVDDPLPSAEAAHATLVLASGRELLVDASGGELYFPDEDRAQELCGELQCAQLALSASAIAELETRAMAVLGETQSRRLQGGGGRRRGGGGGGGGCRRCGGGGGGRRRRGGTPTPTPAPTPLAEAETPEQQAVLDAGAIVSQVFSSSDDLGDIFGGVVRLAFHDAGTFDSDTNTGGADGCVDLSSSENGGLSEIVDLLQPAVDAVSGTLSQADVWALAAGMAIEAAGGPSLEYYIGRIDSSSCTGHAARLPDAEQGHDHILEVFVTTLGFTERETAALFGAHVLGRAQTANSGYNGRWVPNNDRFTNDYFQDLLRRPWDLEALADFNGSARTNWDGPRGTMMLNTDIEIAFDTSSGCTRAGGRGGGNNRCPRATGDLSDAVTEFAQRGSGQSAFFQAFAPAFTKLLALGADDVVCAFDDCHTPGPF